MITGYSYIGAAYIYQGQTYEDVSLETSIDLTSATNLQVLFKKPDGTKGTWTATPNGTKAVVQAVFDQPGVWVLNVFAVIGGKNAYGNDVVIRVRRMNMTPPNAIGIIGEDGTVLTDEHGNIIIVQ